MTRHKTARKWSSDDAVTRVAERRSQQQRESSSKVVTKNGLEVIDTAIKGSGRRPPSRGLIVPQKRSLEGCSPKKISHVQMCAHFQFFLPNPSSQYLHTAWLIGFE